MGRYLTIGLTTAMGFRKADAQKAFNSVKEATEYVSENFAPLDVFGMKEDDNYVIYFLRPDVLSSELTSFLYDFYSIRYKDFHDIGGRDAIIAELKELQTIEEIMDLADECKYANFQKDDSWDCIYCGERWNRLRIGREGIDLSLDGKIMLECDGGLFNFFAMLICEKLQKYKLAKAICVTIEG